MEEQSVDAEAAAKPAVAPGATAKRIVVACGGTGGHAFPGLATAEALRERGHEVTVWNSGRTIEKTVMTGWSGPTFATGAKTLSAVNFFANVRSVFRCVRAFRAAKADVLLAMGSYTSMPPVVAARILRIPVVLHEANAVPGKAVSFLSGLARKVAVSFEQTLPEVPRRKGVFTGLPLRRRMAEGRRFPEIPEGAFCVFTTGGSQGAHKVNELASDALVRLNRLIAPRPLFVIHQTGAADEESVIGKYYGAKMKFRVRAFEYDMADAYASADVVVCRAGASTCFELARAGKPAFFIPLPTAVRDHQHLNAQAFVEKGAAAEGYQDALAPNALANWLLALSQDPDRARKMGEEMARLAVPDAADRLADLVEECAK